MKKKLTITLIIVGIVIVSVIAILFFANRDTTFKATTLSEIQKTLNENSPPCLKASALAQGIPANDRAGIENAVVASIIDVPAGTNVDVVIETFGSTEVTGSARYSGNYGSYNYVAKKVSEISSDASSTDQSQTIWEVTSFVACKP